MTYLTLDDVYLLLALRLSDAGSKSALAREFGVSNSYMGDVLNRTAEPGPTILAKLGLQRDTRYVYTREATNANG